MAVSDKVRGSFVSAGGGVGGWACSVCVAGCTVVDGRFWVDHRCCCVSGAQIRRIERTFVEEAKKLAAWLTSPETQLQAFTAAGTFPSQPDTYDSSELLEWTNPYFSDAPVGEIPASRAEAVDVAPYKGENYVAINDAIHSAITRIEDGTQNADESWEQFTQEIAKLG